MRMQDTIAVMVPALALSNTGSTRARGAIELPATAEQRIEAIYAVDVRASARSR